MRRQIRNRFQLVLILALSMVTTLTALGSELLSISPSQGEALRIELSDDRVRSLRVEIFEAGSGVPVFDSGVVDGQSLEVDLPTALGSFADSALRLELRAWDGSGDLVLSQMSAFPSAQGGEIVSVDFESIPAGTKLLGTPILLDGDVEVSSGLEVAGSLEASEIRDIGGGAFFDECATGSAIRSIDPSGGVICEIDDGGDGAGDNLGNHMATEDLKMSSFSVLFNQEIGLRASGGAEFKTGPFGQTFQLFAGGPTADIARFKDHRGVLQVSINPEGQVGLNNGVGLKASGGGEIKTGHLGQTFQLFAGGPTADIARFKDDQGTLKLSVSPSRGMGFHGGLKICSILDSTGRSSVVASSGWTPATCSSYRNAVTPTGSYQLLCVFDTSFSFGALNGGAPPQNCGW